jgi:hypothetical protein
LPDLSECRFHGERSTPCSPLLCVSYFWCFVGRWCRQRGRILRRCCLLWRPTCPSSQGRLGTRGAWTTRSCCFCSVASSHFHPPHPLVGVDLLYHCCSACHCGHTLSKRRPCCTPLLPLLLHRSCFPAPCLLLSCSTPSSFLLRIYGVPSDPLKTAWMRAMNRVWTEYIEGGGARDPVYLNATRLALKAGTPQHLPLPLALTTPRPFPSCTSVPRHPFPLTLLIPMLLSLAHFLPHCLGFPGHDSERACVRMTIKCVYSGFPFDACSTNRRSSRHAHGVAPWWCSRECGVWGHGFVMIVLMLVSLFCCCSSRVAPPAEHTWANDVKQT